MSLLESASVNERATEDDRHLTVADTRTAIAASLIGTTVE